MERSALICRVAAAVGEAEAGHVAEHEEEIRELRDQVSALRGELAVLRRAGAEQLVKAAKATLDSFNAVAQQRAAVSRLVDNARAELDSLNARTTALAGDVKELKDAQRNFRFAREEPNDGEIIDMPAFLPAPGRSMN